MTTPAQRAAALTTAQLDRHIICEIGRLFWRDNKQCYSADAVYETLLTERRECVRVMRDALKWLEVTDRKHCEANTLNELCDNLRELIGKLGE